jgi:hypothetical protein
MSDKYKAATGISYKSGGEWKVAAAGDLIEIDAEQVKGALARGAIEAAAAKAPPQKEKEV